MLFAKNFHHISSIHGIIIILKYQLHPALCMRKWSKRKIALELLEMHNRGYELRAEVIQRYDRGLFNALFYRDSKRERKYFGSL